MRHAIRNAVRRSFRYAVNSNANIDAMPRNIPTFNGIDTYGTLADPVTFTGDFEVEVEFSCPDASSARALVGYNATFYPSIYIQPTNGRLTASFDDGLGSYGSVTTPVVNYADGKRHTAVISRVGNVFTVTCESESSFVELPSAPAVTFDLIGARAAVAIPFLGQILSVKFTDNSGAEPVVLPYVLDSDSTTTQYARGYAAPSTKYVTWSNFTPDNIKPYTYNQLERRWEGEDVIADGGFDGSCGVTWSCGTGWSIAESKASCDGSQTAYTAFGAVPSVNTVIGSRYLVEEVAVSVSAGNYRPWAGAWRNTIGYVSGVETATTTNFFYQGDTSFTGSLDNTRVRHVLELP